VWATLAAVGIGWGGGAALAHLTWKLRGAQAKHAILDDLVGLGLIAVVYGLSVLAHAWGFLAVFFCGVALRQTELKLAGPAAVAIEQKQVAEAGGLAEAEPQPPAASEEETPAIVSAESLIFEEHLERLSELLLVLLLGGMLSVGFWSWRAVGLALFVFFVARPVSVLLGLLGTRMPRRARGMAAWFGVRGIGSVYYLMYAIQHGLPRPLAVELVELTLAVITLSILVHGASVKFLIDRYDDRMAAVRR
jgi:NhaP-type Na+/H+ or K+/H+ antiporter